MAPDKIYLQVCGDCPKVDCKNCKFEDLEDNVTWCKERIFDQDVEYIRKDALLEWAKETYLNENASAIRKVCYKQLINKLNSM